MARPSPIQYRRNVFVTMAIYVTLMLLEWPHVRGASSPSLKALLALAPLVPVMWVIWLMAKRVVNSDELEQRLHLIALSAATALVAIASLAGGFLSAAGVIALDGDVLIWVFPTLCMTYGRTHLWLGRRYGGMGCG